MRRTMNRLATAGVLLAAMAACGDLTVQPKSQITAANVFTDPSSYKSFLAKLYGGLVLTGQSGPAGNGDVAGIDEGFSQYVRGYWQLQELPTDEAIIGWGDVGLPELNTMTWSASNPFVNAMYSRIYYQVALVNQFLRETTPAKLSERGASAQLQTEVAGYRNEARFLRALSYWHAVDLFGDVPLVDENLSVSALPQQKPRAEVFAFVESELKAIRPLLPAKSTGDYYGRASQAAVDMLLAKLYLNAQVYTGTARWADARAAAEAVIASGAALDPVYQHLFDADNNTSPEMIFTVPQDGQRTQTWGGMTYLVHAGIGGSMNPAAFGVNGGWWGLRTRPNLPDRYAAEPAGDKRAAIVYVPGQSKSIASIGDFGQGYGYPKYRNVYQNGSRGSNLDFPDTDFPMWRLADAYLIYAEAVVRGGGGSMATALGYVNALRERAYGSTAGDVTAADLTLPFILDERSRELAWEGHRRQDLIRFGQFSDAGIWEWKGNVQAGKTMPKYLDLYPIPSNELAANPTIKQNPGY
ncbi:MAG: RagB/SusD family nutrient uptake outer membrane protein [Gemmatimonadaceae bacterium]|nr:RagB/SusD family nutrient uptake outer membrane protein [Gemmatimonadaceae bacterium]NUQ92733.1 RagB/SusD family nutrient uptake outer membrane protein [Gemmatimonadaceae bacterium]NUR18525.1 RagB/SusD family nutrient uptake outer membrane protein [Gemmatimonadaceae bacterium]NUS98842.1 RagB/SusD family nutrient uptake outer membrane protein [Gemmatimonadaceae bacterium]